MKERPILFSAPMVRAILAGTKTQTRRVLNHPHAADVDVWADRGDGTFEMGICEAGATAGMGSMRCPYGKPGDQLWVRETWGTWNSVDNLSPSEVGEIDRSEVRLWYRATNNCDRGQLGRWRPSIHMPRWASRIDLEVTGVRVERLQCISQEDAIAEGADCWVCGGRIDGTSENDCACFHTKSEAVPSYEMLWESINGRGSWAKNPWVWVVEFKAVQS